MPPLSAEEQLRLGLVPPSKGDSDPESNIKTKKLAVLDSGNYRRQITLTPEELEEVRNLLSDCYQDWKRNSSFLQTKLLKYNNKLEGISQAKDQPWAGACTLSIPMPEMHVLSLHAVVTSTILDNDPVFFCRELRPGESEGESVDPNLEWFLTWVTKVQSKSDQVISECIMNAMATPLSFQCKDWVEQIEKEYRVDLYESIEEFQKDYPDADAAGVSDKTYEGYIKELLAEGKIAIRVEEDVVQYRGPSNRAIELKDFVIAPASSRSLRYSVFHGDQYRERGAYYSAGAARKWFNSDEVEKMLKSAGKTEAIDAISNQQDRIEGVSTSLAIRDKNARPYDCVRGNLKWDRKHTGIEELYQVVFHPESKAVLRIEYYPYWHNRTNYIPYKMRTRTNRLQGRCLLDMLWDLSEETDTQHHLRIDSRAIATVPSFKRISLKPISIFRVKTSTFSQASFSRYPKWTISCSSKSVKPICPLLSRRRTFYFRSRYGLLEMIRPCGLEPTPIKIPAPLERRPWLRFSSPMFAWMPTSKNSSHRSMSLENRTLNFITNSLLIRSLNFLCMTRKPGT